MINDKFQYFIKNKNKKDNHKFNFMFKRKSYKNKKKSFLKHFYLIKYL